MDATITDAERRFGRNVKLLDHPILGPLTAKEWRQFHQVHSKLHLRQMAALAQRVGYTSPETSIRRLEPSQIPTPYSLAYEGCEQRACSQENAKGDFAVEGWLFRSQHLTRPPSESFLRQQRPHHTAPRVTGRQKSPAAPV